MQDPADFSKRARAEIDSCADTVCGGSTFTLHEETGKAVDVYGFHPTMDAMKDIKVGTLITAIDLEGKTIIAQFNRGLYFRELKRHYTCIMERHQTPNGVSIGNTLLVCGRGCLVRLWGTVHQLKRSQVRLQTFCSTYTLIFISGSVIVTVQVWMRKRKLEDGSASLTGLGDR